MIASLIKMIPGKFIRPFISSVALLIATLSSSCVHEFPETTDTGAVRLSILHELSWSEYEFVYSRSDDSRQGGWSVRYVIKAYRSGDTSVPMHEFVRYSDDVGRDTFTTRIDLPPGEWDLYVWSDYISDSRQLHDATEFSDITYTAPYTGDTDWRDAFEGSSAAIKVEESYDAAYCVERSVLLKRPTAKYVFIATDFRKFFNETLRPSLPLPAYQAPAWSSLGSDLHKKLLKGYSVTAFYPLFMPSNYDIFRQKVTASIRGASYSASILPLDDDEARIAFDYVLMNHHDTSAQMQLMLHTPSGDRIMMTPTVDVPLKRGQITYVRGKFLTSDIGGGIDIDFDFSGDINIPIP